MLEFFYYAAAGGGIEQVGNATTNEPTGRPLRFISFNCI